jgi:hypothetical protein
VDQSKSVSPSQFRCGVGVHHMLSGARLYHQSAIFALGTTLTRSISSPSMMAVSISTLFGTLFSAWMILRLYNLFYNLYLHPLRKYPGPLGARATTWWKTYIEVVKQESLVHLVIKLHEQYGRCFRQALLHHILTLMKVASFESLQTR